MADKQHTPPEKRLLSLRSRYLLVAGIVAILLVGGSFTATWYVRDVTHQNAESLQHRDRVSEFINTIRNAIWAADIALNAMLISPEAIHEKIIAENLEHAKQQLQNLAANPAIASAQLTEPVYALQSHLEKMTAEVTLLMQLRQDPNWVYPILPYINSKLLEPNNAYETAANLALQEIAADDGGSYASPLYGQFAELRDLWRRKILDFRAVIVRFAGLNNIEITSQELNIGYIHVEIVKRLAVLQQMKDNGELGLQSEESLAIMQNASVNWNLNWNTVKALRASKLWRADTQFMDKQIRPVQNQLLSSLRELEKGILAWSSRNVQTVEDAANQISNELWGLSGLALGFVILVYILIDRSVLSPIARIANAISTEGQESYYRLEDSSSREIYKLVSAFNTMRKQIHQRQMALEHQALHDSLTGLPNRSLLNDRLEQAIHIMRRTDNPMALLLLDLDRFKEINDTLGHHVGDQLLQQVGQRLEVILRDADTIARLGGDEFAIVAPNNNAHQAETFAKKIIDAFSEVFEIENQNLHVGVSIGVAIYPDHGSDPTTLARHADIAMYHAKRNNLGYSLYRESLDEHSVDRLALVGDLHDELKDNRHLQLYYQPQINLFTREVVAVESLLRWDHPQLGFIAPEHIISMAEHTGLIAQLTEWVIDTAIHEYTSNQLHDKKISIAINLSAWNLQDPMLPITIQNIIDKYKMPVTNLSMEITESAMMNDPVRARNVLIELNNMGIELAIDDFGTGFSSLGYLKMLPVNDLKIDKSFVKDMLNDENDAIIVHSTIELAHNLGLNIVAEGVEDNATLLKLRKLKCNVAQGFHISKPIPMDQLKQWLRDYKPRIAQ